MNQPVVLITGAGGLVGQHVLRRLQATGHYAPLAVLHGERVHGQAAGPNATVSADLLQAAQTADLARLDPAFIVHAAGVLPATMDDAAAAQANLTMDRNVAELAAATGCGLVYCSSISVYENAPLPWHEEFSAAPVSSYPRAKLASEALCATRARRSVSLRLSSPYGSAGVRAPRAGVLTRFVKQALAGETLRVHGRGTRAQDFVHAADIAAAVEAILQRWQTGTLSGHKVINLAAGKPISMLELATLVMRLSGLSGQPQTSPELDGDDGYQAVVSIERARQLLDWQPGRLEDGLLELIAAGRQT
jgi:nucleoside-diphosphate-sugar epimerase